MEENPLNNNSSNSFYIRAPKEMSTKQMFNIWDEITEEVHAFARKEGIETLAEVCHVAVSKILRQYNESCICTSTFT